VRLRCRTWQLAPQTPFELRNDVREAHWRYRTDNRLPTIDYRLCYGTIDIAAQLACGDG
jgi:hypothetical protein